MNTQQYFTHFVKKGIICTFLTFITLFSLKAQCTLTPWSAISYQPMTASCQSITISPMTFLQDLDVTCPAGIGVSFNLKIYDAAGTTPVYDFNNLGGNSGAFPIIDLNALGLAGKKRKARIERLPSGQFATFEVIFQVPISCGTPKTLEANDDLTLANPVLFPTNASSCMGSLLTNICIDQTSVLVTNLPCNDPSGNYRKMTRIVKSSDNSTGACTQTIFLKKADITTTSAPANYTDPTNKGCAFLLANRNPNTTGFPVYNGKPLSNATAVAGTPYTIGNIEITYTDALQTPACGGEVFYKRTWTIKDLCAASPMQTFVQDIRSKETQSPVIQPLASVTINASNTSCNALNFQIPTATVTDNCSTPTVSVLITNASTSLTTTNGGTIASIGIGVYNLRYTVTDDCGNPPTVTNITLTIIDATVPSITCSAKMVALNNVGTGATSATKFVDQLNDNCGASLNMVQIKRMTDPNTAYSATLGVTCADINKPFMVMLKASDFAGNLNYCMTTVDVQDKLAPQFVQIADSIVNCPVDTNYLKNLNPIVTDGCGFTLKKAIKNWTLANCRTGTFDICYTATDIVGNVATMTRKITVVNQNPFTKSMIIRPKDITIKNFNGSLALLEPEKLDTGSYAPAIPKWNYTGCDLIALSKKDDVFYVNGSNCCFKIFRTWKIANCCMMDPLTPGPKVLDEFIQVIKIEDDLAPTIKGMPTDITVGTQNCLAVVTLPKPAFIDDCAGSLPLNSIVVTTNLPNKSATDDYKYTNVPKGIYTVTYSVSDACGNNTTGKYNVTVKDLIQPTPIAAHGLAANLGADGTLMLTAKHFDKGSKDNCTPSNKLIFAFSPDPADTMIMYDCNTFKTMCDSQKIAVLVKLWVRDEAGNWAFVETYIALSKYNTPCTCFKNIAGAIKTSKGDKVQDVLVNITSNGVSIIKPFTTNASGVFSVPNITSGNNFTVSPKKNDDVVNGVSTSDIVLITKHILGQQTFTSPYQWIAADVNKNGKVTTGDVVELRKLILGTSTLFVNNTSWRFMDNAFTFKNANDPLSEVFPETKQSSGNSTNTDFTAIKIGDVNNSAKASNASGQAGDRGGNALEFMVNDMKVKAGETYSVPFKVTDLENIAGYQFTLNYDKNALEFVDVKSTNNGADADFGLTHLQDGVVTTSWINPTSIAFPKMETVFTVTFKAKTSDYLSKTLKLSSDLTKAEAYTHSGEAMNVKLDFAGKVTATNDVQNDKFELFQNQPNPFKNATLITFNLPEAAHATLTVYDQTGRMIQRIDDDFSKGRNEMRLEVLSSAGLYFYRLDTPEHSATRRMLLME